LDLNLKLHYASNPQQLQYPSQSHAGYMVGALRLGVSRPAKPRC